MTKKVDQRRSRRRFQLVAGLIFALIIGSGIYMAWQDISEGGLVGVLLRFLGVIALVFFAYRSAGRAKSS